ncbi:DUF7344 domain-containing protein [Halorussus marinus]|nr:hypothetical protein [Halorussus marinus]
MSIARAVRGLYQRLASDDSPDSTIPASTEQVLFLLKNKRRRLVVQELAETESPIRLRNLTARVTARQHDGDYSTDQRKAVYCALYQSHLPKLDDAGLVDFNSERGTVSYTHDVIADIATLLARIENATADRTGGDD